MSVERYRLIDALRLAGARSLASGWLYLREDGAISPDLDCLLVAGDDEEFDERGVSMAAVQRGFTREGLDTDTLAGTFDWAKNFIDPPPDKLLLESFTYYLRFDAFLPEPGAPDPPPWEETQQRLDRAFFDSLGPERAEEPCREPGCSRGAVRLSVLCRRHHFENVQRRPCPFE
jgi:hypothetical protein